MSNEKSKILNGLRVTGGIGGLVLALHGGLGVSGVFAAPDQCEAPTPTPTKWSRSSVEAQGACDANCEVVSGTVCNTGDGDMAGPAGWELWYTDGPGAPKNGTELDNDLYGPLDKGECQTITYSPVVSGRKYQFGFHQEEGHPGEGITWTDECSAVCEATPTNTNTPEIPTDTPTPSNTPTNTATPTYTDTPEIPTDTPTPSLTNTPFTVTPSVTASLTATPYETPEEPTETPGGGDGFIPLAVEVADFEAQELEAIVGQQSLMAQIPYTPSVGGSIAEIVLGTVLMASAIFYKRK